MRQTGVTPLRLKLLVFAVSSLVCLFVFEVTCRLVGVDFNPNPIWRFHALLGWTQAPSQTSHHAIDGDAVTVEFNSLGFRDVEHSLTKPAGTKRVVVVGDSFSEAIEVNLDETYWRRLQHMLNAGRSERWEAINLGVGDFGNAQAWLALTELGQDYSPDLVIFQIFPLNDICNNTIELAGLCKSLNDPFRPYFVLDGDEPRITHSQPVRHWLRSRFYSFGLLERSYLTFRQSGDADELHRKRHEERGFRTSPLVYTFARADQQPKAVARGWVITERILESVQQWSRSSNVPWLPVVIPFEARVGGEAWRDFEASYPDVPMERRYPEDRLGRLFERMGIPSVMLLDTFERNLALFRPTRGGHLNPESHRLAAETILDKLETSGVLGSDPD